MKRPRSLPVRLARPGDRLPRCRAITSPIPLINRNDRHLPIRTAAVPMSILPTVAPAPAPTKRSRPLGSCSP